MPYKDPEKKRLHDRVWKRAYAAAHPEIVQVAYETYFVEMENTAPAGFLRWQALEPREHDAWEAAGQAVLALRPPAEGNRDA